MVSRTKISSGRIDQKRRTRRAVLDAAARILARGDKPRMERVAEEAGVSRATAYRYFPSEEMLLIEATLDRMVPALDAMVDDASRDPVEKAVDLTRTFYDLAADQEPGFRLYLRATLETGVEGKAAASRGGRRPESFQAVLEPLRDRVDAATLERLTCALSALTGIEALIVAKDVCRLDTDRGREAMVWAARTLLRAALASGPGTR